MQNKTDEIDAINRFLLEKVMGWQFDQPPQPGFFCLSAPTKDAPVWIKTHDGWQCGICNGTPDFTQWADCEPLLSQIELDGVEWVLEYFDGSYSAELQKPTDSRHLFRADADTRTAALCLCIARAYGFNQGGPND